jgi:hypothetical protein
LFFQDFTLTLSKILKMDTLNINVTKQMDGFIFGLTLSERRALVAIFPDLQPLKCIVVGFGAKGELSQLFARLEKHIVPALIGLDDNGQMKGKIKNISLNESVSGEQLYTFEV